MGTGPQPQNTRASLEALLPATTTEDPDTDDLITPRDWMKQLPPEEETRRKRHTNVSQDIRNTNMDLFVAKRDAECTEAPTRIPA